MAMTGGNPLAALLAAHAPGGPPQGQPSSIQVQPQGGGQQDPSAALKAAILAVRQAEMAADDQVDKQTIAKCYVALQGILANEQKQKEAALGTTPALKHLAKSSRGASY